MSTNPLKTPPDERLRFLVETVLAEPVGPAIDNIARAEKLGLVASGQAWIEARQLRNFMIHEYVRDAARLASALRQGHAAVPLLVQAATAMAQVCGLAPDNTRDA